MAALIAHIDHEKELAVVKAPPGSGKTWRLLRVAQHAYRKRLRVAVATQTNSQADDICRRLSAGGARSVRFASRAYGVRDLGPCVAWETSAKDLPSGPCIVVGTTAKWGLINLPVPLDVCLVEEAWQMAWADFHCLARCRSASS